MRFVDFSVRNIVQNKSWSWFLLHCCYTDIPFERCEQVIPKLQKELIAAKIVKSGQKYNKNMDLYLDLKPKLQQVYIEA